MKPKGTIGRLGIVLMHLLGFFIILAIVVCIGAGFNDRNDYITEINSKTSIGHLENFKGEYTGELIGVERNGSGQFDFDAGETYIGDWKNDVIGGKGSLSYPETGEYTGEYKGGKRHGTGVFIWTNGDKYEGHWENDNIDGEGVLTKADGSSLKGVFSKGILFSGTEEIHAESGSYIYTIEDGAVTSAQIKLASGTEYTGSVENGSLSGAVKVTYPNGDTYDGNFSGGKRSGQGTYTWSDGSGYVGAWSEDAMSGEGKYYYTSDKNGARLEGSFSANSPRGECNYISSDGKTYVTTWSGGQCTNVKKEQ